METNGVLIISKPFLIMKMILKVELFVSAEAEEVSARDLKREVQKQILSKEIFFTREGIGRNRRGTVLEYPTYDGRKLKASVMLLSEDEAYDSLK